MSQITRCPACGTLFKVVADQLKISDGWVRCGHCAEVFDAAAHLQGDFGPAQEQAASPAPPAPSPRPVEAESSDASAEAEAFASSLNTEVGESVGFEAPDSAQIEAEAEALVEDPRDRPFEFEYRRRDDSELEPPQARTEARSSWEGDSRTDSESPSEFASKAGDAAVDEVSFVRSARRKAYWARPGVRAVLVASACVLGILLVLQFALHERDRLAVAEPALRPLLAALCAPLDCRVAPLRQIDSIAIDSSSFNKLRGDAYRLNVTLKNQAGFELAMPALELTLTDGQDRPLVRRVLMPGELAPGANAIAAASEWSGSLALALANAAGPRIAGYRLLAFYP